MISIDAVSVVDFFLTLTITLFSDRIQKEKCFSSSSKKAVFAVGRAVMFRILNTVIIPTLETFVTNLTSVD